MFAGATAAPANPPNRRLNDRARTHRLRQPVEAAQEKQRKEEAKAAKARAEGKQPKARAESTAELHAARHENYVWGLKGTHVAQNALRVGRGRPAAGQPKPTGPRLLEAISALGPVYRTELGPVVLTDLKREFEAYLEAHELCDGMVPADLKVRVGSRLHMFAADTHISLAYAYAHQNINGRPRCAPPMARAACATAALKLQFRSKAICQRNQL